MVLVGILIIAQKLTGSAWMPPIIFVSPFKQLIKTITQRMTRSAILEILREDYVLNARAYGLNEFSIINSNVLRNSSRPIITVLGSYVGNGECQFKQLLGMRHEN